MPEGDAHDLLAFEHVRVIGATPGALRCVIGDKRVWLPREHIKGTLCRRGDSGPLMVRRWVAADRRLVLPGGSPVCAAGPRMPGSSTLRLLRSNRFPNGR